MCLLWSEDGERLEGGDGGHRPGAVRSAEVRGDPVSHPGLVHIRSCKYLNNQEAAGPTEGRSNRLSHGFIYMFYLHVFCLMLMLKEKQKLKLVKTICENESLQTAQIKL